MAVIGQIRKHSGLLIVIVGIALAAFVLGDFLKPSASRPNQYVGSVDGTEISTIDFETKVDERIEATRNQRQTDKLSPQDIFQIRQAVWNEMVEDILLEEELEDIGLNVTSEELSDQILGENPHQFVKQSFTNPNTGAFDQEMLRNFLQNLDNQNPDMKRRYLNLESLVKKDRKKTKFRNLISKAYFVPEQFAKLDYIQKNSNADIRYVAARFTSVEDSLVQAEDSELRKYYNENQFRYEQDETRAIDYVIFEVLPSDEDRKQIANTVNEIYNEFKEIDEVDVFVNSVSDTDYDSTYKKQSELPARIAEDMFSSPIGTMVGPYIENETYYISKLIDREERPDSLKMSQILITYANAPAAQGLTDRPRTDAENLVDSLKAVLDKNPAKFDDLAVEFSDFPSASEDKGDMGWVIDGTPGFGPYYDNGYKMKTGTVEKIETTLGFHIIKINEKTELVEKARVATITRAIEPSNETYQEKYLEASIFAGTNNTLAKFDTAVINQGLNKRSSDNLTAMANRLAGLQNSRQIIRWAFSLNTSVGNVSPVFEDENKYVVAALKQIREEGLTPFEDVKDQIRPLVVNEKKGEILEDRINNFGTTDLYQIADKLGEAVDTATISYTSRNLPGFGSEYELIGKIFTLEPGVSSGPLKGNNAVFVIIADDIKRPEDKEDYTANVGMVERKFTSQFMGNSYIEALKNKADIEDNRLNVY